MHQREAGVLACKGHSPGLRIPQLRVHCFKVAHTLRLELLSEKIKKWPQWELRVLGHLHLHRTISSVVMVVMDWETRIDELPACDQFIS
mmetsp:Transcript_4605/g.8716  ORF Transcript_4605/g.8716 Transcript_4605/m.8716 type:complete len:89 (-) Transcript_4605:259-525(-)